MMEEEDGQISSTVSDSLIPTLHLDENMGTMIEVQHVNTDDEGLDVPVVTTTDSPDLPVVTIKNDLSRCGSSVSIQLPVVIHHNLTSSSNVSIDLPVVPITQDPQHCQEYEQSCVQQLMAGSSELPMLYREVPDVVAAETVVTTTEPRRRKQTFDVKYHNVNVLRSGETELSMADSSTGNEEDMVSWQALLNTDTEAVLVETTTIAREAHDQNENGFVALVPDSTGLEAQVTMHSHPVTLHGTTKRDRDRAKKRLLRANKDFREKEKQQAKLRMALKRADPAYREKERENDRIRRRQARLHNDNQRQKERERDRHYKRLQRSIPMTLSEVKVEGSSISAEEMILNEVEIGSEGYGGVVGLAEEAAIHYIKPMV